MEANRDKNRIPTLIASSTIDHITPVTLDANPTTHALEVNASVSVTGGATASNQTDGSQKTQIVDAGGDSSTVTNSRLDTNSLIGNTLITVPFDYIGVAYPDTSTEIYTYKTGGSGGTTVGTVTVVYSDAVTKQIITSVTKT
jgi:hypothetical protein